MIKPPFVETNSFRLCNERSFSKWKSLGFAIVIILGINGFALAGIALTEFGITQGWWQIRSLIQLTQVNMIILMSMGDFGVIIYLIVSITHSQKNRCNRKEIHNQGLSQIQPTRKNSESVTHNGETTIDASKTISNPTAALESPIDIFLKDKIARNTFGPVEWQKYFNVRVDSIPHISPPPMKEILKCMALYGECWIMYMPSKVNDNPFSINIFNDLVEGHMNGFYFQKDHFNVDMTSIPVNQPYWFLMSKSPICNSLGKSYEAQKSLMPADCRHPTVLESSVCILMEYRKSGICYFSNNPLTYTYCEDVNTDKEHFVVGSMDGEGIMRRLVSLDGNVGAAIVKIFNPITCG